MKEVKAYELKNGEVFKQKWNAIKRQKQIDFERRVCEFAEKTGVYEGVQQIENAILGNADELLAILNER